MVADLITIIVVPIGRALLGWAEKAFSISGPSGRKVDSLEWRKLFETVFRVGVPSAALFYGFAVPIGIATGLPVVADYVYSYLKKLKTKK